MKFTKMQGLGNDYVYVNCLKETVENPSETAKKISDRHFGIGADGLILICPSDVADFEMKMYNADGSRGEMCGNGIRCVGKYVYDYGLTTKTHLNIETLAGIRSLDLTLEEGRVKEVRVDMGRPILEPEEIPVSVGEETPEMLVSFPIEVEGDLYHFTGVSMGNPHAVVFTDEEQSLPELDLEEIGPKFETHPYFPNRINTEFVQVLDPQQVNMRVWERGSGETYACGTGACAVVVAGVLNGLTEDQVTVHLTGGDLKIEWDREKDTVYMTGPAETVFDGEINL